jgi:hypothetical protein
MNRAQTTSSGRESPPTRHSGHGWMMIACCIPMLAIAIVLVATGVASAILLIGAIACMAMMGLMMVMMMRGMSGGGK